MSSPLEGRRTLGPDNLAWRCPADWLAFRTTSEITSHEEVLPQEDAVAALRLGLRIRARGYNVYVAGAPGTGRTSTVLRLIEQERGGAAAPDDLVYVHNLKDPRAPRFLRLSAGSGRRLRDAMAAAAERFRQGLAALRASGAHRRRREAVAREFSERQSKLVDEFQQEIGQQGYGLVEVSLGPTKRHEVAPIIDGRPVPLAELATLVHGGKMSSERAEQLVRLHADYAARLAEVSGQFRDLRRAVDMALADADREAARPLVEEPLAEIRGALGLAVGVNPPLDQYLEEMGDYLLNVVPYLFSAGEAAAGELGEDIPGPDPLEALRVNVLIDRTGQPGRPLVEETQPSVARLLGYVEVIRTPDGAARSELGGIRPGALHAADGGFLVINAHDLVAEEGAWVALRRALRTGKVSVLVGVPGDGPPPMVPQDATVDVTVILVGSPALRDALAQGDEEFGKLFKVTAVMDDRVPLTREAVASYAAYLARVTAQEQLLPFEAPAVARIVEFLVRQAGARNKLSTRFRLLTDLAREASWHAREAGAVTIGCEHVELALNARRARQGVLSARVLESIEEGTLLLDLVGHRVGQVNGLAVVETNLERFGYPVRITATSAVGRSGIIDIEREADLSGEIHTKASLILGGYLRSRFAQHLPLALTASICFEQSYGGVEGDSASGAELVALLSSLSGIPVRQDLAVTGAVDQQGNVLAVGGVNEKIEGFWQVCRRRGLSGTQGVIIPVASVDTLQLERELVNDVERGQFHVHTVRNVDDMVELTLGVALGEPDASSDWPAGSLGDRIAARIREMANVLREYGDQTAP